MHSAWPLAGMWSSRSRPDIPRCRPLIHTVTRPTHLGPAIRTAMTFRSFHTAAGFTADSAGRETAIIMGHGTGGASREEALPAAAWPDPDMAEAAADTVRLRSRQPYEAPICRRRLQPRRLAQRETTRKPRRRARGEASAGSSSGSSGDWSRAPCPTVSASSISASGMSRLPR